MIRAGDGGMKNSETLGLGALYVSYALFNVFVNYISRLSVLPAKKKSKNKTLIKYCRLIVFSLKPCL